MNDLSGAFDLNLKKAIETIVYIARNAPIPDIYHVGKIIYFADKLHLQEFGNLICGDQYTAMEAGPVPSAVYDLLKDVRDCRETSKVYEQCIISFDVAGKDGDHMVTALREPDMEYLADSDIECINRSIEENGKLSFSELKHKSHDSAYKKADLNDDISIEAIIDSLPSAEEIKQYIKENTLD